VLENLVAVYAEVAREDAVRDGQRLMRGLLCLTAGALGLGLATALVQVAAVFLAHDAGLRWPWAALAVAGGDAAVSGVLGLIGRRALRGPVLVATRRLVHRTLRVLGRGQ
jgi:hypothetical protein